MGGCPFGQQPTGDDGDAGQRGQHGQDAKDSAYRATLAGVGTGGTGGGVPPRQSPGEHNCPRGSRGEERAVAMAEGLRGWAARHVVPLVGTAAVLVVGMNLGIEWNPLLHHTQTWAGAIDVWRSYAVSDQALGGHLGQVYAPGSGLVGPPGPLVLFAPAVALSQMLHLSVGGPILVEPTAWVVLEPWILLLSSSVLFAADTVACRLGVGPRRRWALMAAEVFVLWDVAFWYGHPEYPVAVALVLFAALDALDGRWSRCGWLFGVAIACQPIALATVGVAFALAPTRRWAGLVVRMAVPPAVVLAGPLVAGWTSAYRTLHLQPEPLFRDHPTPLAHLAPHLPGDWVSGAPMRSIGTLVAFAFCWLVCRRRPSPATVVAALSVAFLLRCLIDPVLVSYYVFAPLAVGLVAAAASSRVRFAAACILAAGVTVYAQLGAGGEWRWPLVVVGGTAVVVGLGWPSPSRAFDQRERAPVAASPGPPGPAVGGGLP